MHAVNASCEWAVHATTASNTTTTAVPAVGRT